MTKRAAMLLLAVTGVLGACTTTKDFRDEAAKFIESNDVAEQLNLAFSDAECVEPESTKVGTEFDCTAMGADGVKYAFVVKISDDKAFTLNPPEPVG